MYRFVIHVPWEAFPKTSANSWWLIFHSIFWVLATLNFWFHTHLIFCIFFCCSSMSTFSSFFDFLKAIHTRDCALFFQMTKLCTRYWILLEQLKIALQSIYNSHIWLILIVDSLVYSIWSYSLKYGYYYSNFIIIY